MTYQVEITETLQRIVAVEAKDEQSAVVAVRQMYRNEEIVLDSSDYIDTKIERFTH
ncbi:MAG: DpnD/PcfM family protein [Oscillospiraceae bacterium]|nr:DpnD/PcfM family protein [Oscillospiraceae bacterium]